MSNEFYNPSGSPSTGSAGASATMRAEFAAVQAAFDKLPVMNGHANEIVVPNAGGTALTTLNAAQALTAIGAQPLDADLTALAALDATVGVLIKTAAATYARRVVEGTTNQITVTNGNGVAGNITLTLPQNIHTGASPTFSGLTLNTELVAPAVGNIAGTNTITGSMSPALSAYVAGQLFVLTPANTITGAATLNINSLGAKNIFYAGATVGIGDLIANVPYLLEYDGTQFSVIGAPINRTSYTGTLTGCTTAPTATVVATKVGNMVTLDIPSFSATSNATTKTITGMGTDLRPASTKTVFMATQDNGGNYVISAVDIETTGVITIYSSASKAAFTASGNYANQRASVCYTQV